MSDPLKPNAALLCKIGSILVHIDEGLSNEGHEFDIIAIRQLLRDDAVFGWLYEMDKLAMVPKKRNNP
jgi:hypothetical protein